MLVSLWLKLNNEVTSLDQCVHCNSVVSICFGGNMINVIQTYKEPVKLIKRVKIAHSFLQSVSNQFHVIILNLPM